MLKKEKSLILLNSVYNFCASLVSTFINVYLYIYTNSIPMMCLYSAVRVGCYPLFFMLGTKIVKKHPFTLTYTIGLSLITISLIYTLAGGSLFEQSPYYVLLAALVLGSGEGFYWFSTNSCIQTVPSNENRGKFYVYNSIVGTIAGLFAPILATLVLNNVADEMQGYRILLYIIVSVFVVVIFISLNINEYSHDKDSNVLKALDIRNDERWRDHNIAVYFHGLRDGLGLNTINLLVYRAAGSGGVYSKIQTLFSFISIVAYFITKRLLNREHITLTATVGVAFRLTCTWILLYIPNLGGAIAYGLLNTFACAFYDNSFNFLSARIIGKYKDEMTVRVVAKETYLTLGRVSSMCVVLLCYAILPENLYLVVSATLLSLGPLMTRHLLLKHKD